MIPHQRLAIRPILHILLTTERCALFDEVFPTTLLTALHAFRLDPPVGWRASYLDTADAQFVPPLDARRSLHVPGGELESFFFLTAGFFPRLTVSAAPAHFRYPFESKVLLGLCRTPPSSRRDFKPPLTKRSSAPRLSFPTLNRFPSSRYVSFSSLLLTLCFLVSYRFPFSSFPLSGCRSRDGYASNRRKPRYVIRAPRSFPSFPSDPGLSP